MSRPIPVVDLPVPTGTMHPEKWGDTVPEELRNEIITALCDAEIEIVKIDPSNDGDHYWHLRYKDLEFELGVEFTLIRPGSSSAFLALIRHIEKVYELNQFFDEMGDPWCQDIWDSVTTAFPDHEEVADLSFTIICEHREKELGRQLYY
jgi:hypothetical protein